MAAVRFTKHAMVFIAFLHLVTSFSNSQIINDQHLPDLIKERLDALEAKVIDLTVQLEQEKILRSNLEVKLEAVLLTSGKTAEPASHHIEKNTKGSHGKVEPGRFSGGMPSNCGEIPLVTAGYDGLYLIFNQDLKKVQIVYCQSPVVDKYQERLLGNIEIAATTSVHFYVQRRRTISFTTGVLTFDEEKLNVGGAMDLNTGIFTAPVSGVYSFQFSALKDLVTGDVFIYLQVNGLNVACSYANSLTQQMALVPIAASLHLTAGDKVTLYKQGAGLFDDGTLGKYLTQFTGSLVEEDL